ASSTSRAGEIVSAILRPLASLKLTVVLFALAIFLVFASTLAQKEMDVWEVVHGWYRIDLHQTFNSQLPFIHPSELFVRIPIKTFFVDMFITHPPQWEWGFWFPRGWLIGLFMTINLLAAHTVRFTVQSRGTKLWAGLAVLVVGCLATYAAIESGS